MPEVGAVGSVIHVVWSDGSSSFKVYVSALARWTLTVPIGCTIVTDSNRIDNFYLIDVYGHICTK